MITTMPAAGAPVSDAERVAAIVERLSLEEKTAQIVGFWEKGDGEVVAPLQGEFTRDGGLDDAMRHGLGHLTRVYGTRPVDPVTGRGGCGGASASWSRRSASPRSSTRSA